MQCNGSDSEWLQDGIKDQQRRLKLDSQAWTLWTQQCQPQTTPLAALLHPHTVYVAAVTVGALRAPCIASCIVFDVSARQPAASLFDDTRQ